jgi:hypothetical protein
MMVEPLMQLLGLCLVLSLNSCKLTLLHQSLIERSDEIWPYLMALWTWSLALLSESSIYDCNYSRLSQLVTDLIIETVIQLKRIIIGTISAPSQDTIEKETDHTTLCTTGYAIIPLEHREG